MAPFSTLVSNTQHYHSGIGYQTPEAVHYGRAQAIRDQRAKVLAEAYQRHPERFVRGMPTPDELPTAVWINPPKENFPPQITAR